MKNDDAGAADPYLWLEQIGAEDALDWVRQQNASAQRQLEGVPAFAALHLAGAVRAAGTGLLAREEGENWVWPVATCLKPAGARCLVSLSGGGGATVVREFDLEARAFVDGGFVLPEAIGQARKWRR